MKTKRVLLSMAFLVAMSLQLYSQTTIGRQLVDQYPITPWGTPTYGLTWLPPDYHTSTTKYPLIIFLHGAGEVGDGVGGLYNLISTALPQKIANGWDPQAVNPVDGQNYQFIVVSPQAPWASHWSYQYGHVQFILKDVINRYRIDTNRVYVTGLSAGGAGTWSCVTNGPEGARKFAAIVPVASAGVNYGHELDSIPYAGSRYGVKLWQVCGALDAWNSFVTNSTNLYNSGTPTPNPQAVATALPGLGHVSGAWNTAYEPTWRTNAHNKNIYEWMLQYSRSSSTASTAPVANAGPAQSITLPANAVTLSGSGTAAAGNTITGYAWSKVSGPSAFSIASPTSATTQVTGLAQGTYVFRLTVTDNLNVTATSDVQVTVNPAPNQAPTAQAGADQSITLPVNTVTLSGSGSDPDGTIASYQWSRISGPSQFTIASPSSAQTSISNLVQGTYSFELKVTDNGGATATDIVSITVNPAPNQAPTANAGSDASITLPVNTVTLSGSGTDVDGTIASYQWAKVSGPSSYTISSPAQAQTSVNNLVAGTYEFELLVTDNSGSTAKDTVSITVNPAPNQAPTANAGSDAAVTLPVSSITLNGSGSDADGTIASYNWSTVSGPSCLITSPAQAVTTVTNLGAGVYKFELTVTDNSGSTGKDTVVITVAPAPNQPPVVHVCRDTAITLPENTVPLSGQASDPDGSVTSYQWSKVSGPATYTIADAASAQTTISGLAEGVYTLELKATDDNGASSTDTVVITVNAAMPPPNQAPTANAGSDLQTTLPADSVLLSGSGTDADGTIASYQWTKISGPATYHINNASAAQTWTDSLQEGVYEFELTVTDNSGASAKDTVTITVLPAPNTPPTADAGSDITITLPVDSALLNGSGADADGSIASYKWTKISGPSNDSLASSSAAQTWVHQLTQGTYSYELKVTDNRGASATDTIIITVNAQLPNVAPVVDAGADQTIILPADSVTVLATATDSDGSIASYQWSKISGPLQYSIVSPAQAQTVIKNLVQGTYRFQVVATDNEGAASADTITIQVSTPANNCNGVRHYFTPGPDGGRYITGDPAVSGWHHALNPGDTIVLKAQQAWTYFSMEKYYGTASCPIVIINEGGQVWMTAGIEIKNAHHIKVTGSGSASNYYGFKIYNPGNDGSGVAIGIQGRTKHVEVERIDVRKKTYGVWAKQDPQCDTSFNYPNYTMDDIEIHHCRFRNIGQDCIYAGNTDPIGMRDMYCNGVLTHMIPMRISNINIHHNIIDSVNRTAIQVSGADQGYNQVHNNIISNCGYELDQQQGTGISIGGMTRNCRVYNNNIKNTFLYGILSFGVGTNYIENNVVDSSGWLGGVPNTVSQPSNILVSTKVTIPFDSSTIIIRNNRLGLNATQDNNNIYIAQWGPPSWSVNNMVCGNTLLGGTAPATVFVSPGIHVNTCDTTVANIPPVVNAGNDITINAPTDSVTLSGSATDVDGSIISYKWTLFSGSSSYMIGSPEQAQTVIRSLAPGAYTFRLTAMDNDSATATDDVEVMIIPSVVNIPPVANAGPDHALPYTSSTVTVTGSGTDADGTIISYQWMKIAGPTQYTIVSIDSAQTLIKNLVAGTYKFELTVVDNEVAMGKDTIIVTVDGPPNVPPTVNAGADQTVTGTGLFLTGSASDPDGSVVSYAWSKVSGPSSYDINSPNTPATGISGLTPGVYVFRLTATDNQGAIGMDDVQITVYAPPPPPPNQAPVANAGNDIAITLPVNSVTLSGSAADADGTVAGYGWAQVSGPSQAAIGSPASAQTTVSNLTEGVYVFRLTATDDDGDTGSDLVTVTVLPQPVNIPPVVNAGQDITITLPVNSVILSGTATDADGIASYSWTQVSGPAQYSIVNPAGAQTAVEGLVQGVYRFSLSVTDNGGASASDTIIVTVLPAPVVNIPPVADAGADVSITLPVSTAALFGSGTDADGTVLYYQWTKVSGPAPFVIGSPNNPQTTVSGLTEGVYVFRLQVTDNSGATATDDVVVTVYAPVPPPNQAPVANAGIDRVITLPLNSVLLMGTGTDPDGTITAYNWAYVSGPSQYSIASPASPHTAVNGLAQGTYRFRLTVTDDRGATDSDTMTVVVNPVPQVPVNVPPVAVAGNDKLIMLPNNTVTLQGTGTDPDGFIVGYRWRKLNGPSGSLADPNSDRTTATNLAEGVYEYELMVTDNGGASSTDTVQVMVKKLEVSRVSAYPNPATDIVNIEIEANTHVNLTTLIIYDQGGRAVYRETFMRTQTRMTRQVNLSRLPSGNYLIEVAADINSKVTCKVLKQ
jgi:K+-transporting ATPase c subunit